MDTQKSLKHACIIGDLENVKILVRNGANIYDDKMICMSLACYQGHFDIVKYLVSIINNDIESELITYEYSRSFYGPCIGAENGRHIDIMHYLLDLDFKYPKDDGLPKQWYSGAGRWLLSKYLNLIDFYKDT